MGFDQTSVSSLTIISSFLNKGFMALSLTDFTTSAQSLIASGSAVEVVNTCFYADSNITISGFSAITTATTCYIHLLTSGTAPTQILSAQWSSTAPVWVEGRNGWYASAGSAVRVIGSAYKVSATQQECKTLYTQGRDNIFTRVIDIGDWNMLASTTLSVLIGMRHQQIRDVGATIRNDLDTGSYPLDCYIADATQGGISYSADLTGERILMERATGGLFDSNNFDSTSYNRGYILIEYEG